MEGIPVLGEGARLVNCYCRLHRVPDDMVVMRLRDQIVNDLGLGWYAVVMFGDGRGTMRGCDVTVPEPEEAISTFLFYLAVRLNRECHHDGHWVVVWSKNRIIHLMFRDRDGDLQFSHSIDDAWTRVEAAGIAAIVEQAEIAHATWSNLLFGGIAPREDQLYRAARGEKPPSGQ